MKALVGLFVLALLDPPPTTIQLDAVDFPVAPGGQICFALDTSDDWACARRVEPLVISGLQPGQHILRVELKDEIGVRVSGPHIHPFVVDAPVPTFEAGIEFTAPSNGALVSEPDIEVHFSCAGFTVPNHGYIRFMTSGGAYLHRQPSLFISMQVGFSSFGFDALA
jgi:hypothetical protein